ncbi:MAG TPA: cell wall hydrolase [Roseomonas sp.]|jgi:spore germination cell wall hydrolase CwlJ-like protein
MSDRLEDRPRGLLDGIGEWFSPTSVPDGAGYDAETLRASRMSMLAGLGANLLAGSRRGLEPAQRAQYIAAAGQAPAEAQQILMRGAEQQSQRQLRQAQISRLTAQQTQGAALARMLMGGDAPAGGAAPAPASGGAPSRAAASPTIDLSSYTPPEGVDRDTDLAVRTVLGEAGNQGPVGQSAVAHVIRNRVQQSGQTPEQVVLAPSQFEPWNTDAGRQRLLSIDPRSPAYQNALRVVQTAFADGSQDPTQGATHFYAPDLQARLGRQPPAWAEGQQAIPIGAQNFYRLSYRPPGGPVAQAAGGGSPPPPQPTPLNPAQATLASAGGPPAGSAAAPPIPAGRTALPPQGGAPMAGPTPAAAPPMAPLNPAQQALAAPSAAARTPPGYNGNTLAAMPRELRLLAAQAAAAGDIDGARGIVTQWLTRAPPQVQTMEVGGRRVELRPDGSVGRDYGPTGAADTTPLTEQQMVEAGVPQAQARGLARLSRAEQEQGIRGLVTRAPQQTQMTEVAGRRREVLPSGELGRDYGPAGAADTTPLTEQDMLGHGVPAQTARMLASLSRPAQEEGIRSLASRETKPGSEQEDALRREYTALPPVARLSQSAPLYRAVTGTLDRLRDAQRSGQPDRLGELDAVIGLANLFDPGSVVREGEVTNVQRTQDLPTWFVGQLNRVIGGQSLGPDMLRQMEAAAAGRMRAYREAAAPYATTYRGIAERRGLSAENAVPDFGDAVAARESERRQTRPAPAPQSPGPGGAGTAEPPPASPRPPRVIRYDDQGRRIP